MKEYTSNHLKKISKMSKEDALKVCNSCHFGLTNEQVAERIHHENKNISHNTISIIFHSFFTPFTAVLFVVAVIALITGLLDSYDNIISAIIIFVVILLSGTIQCIQNLKANNSYNRLDQLSKILVTVKREGILIDVSSCDIVEGDIVLLSAGSRIPADLRIISGEISVSQAAFTGESKIIKKNSEESIKDSNLKDLNNILFFGSIVISGKCEAVVVNEEKNILYKHVTNHKKNNYQKGAGSILKVILFFILFLVPISLLVVGLTTHSFSRTILFALTVAIGLVPEMLPLVISVCLTKGSHNMMKKKTLVRNINTMQDFASVDVLCVDKTGTLTDNEINLEYYLDLFGNESQTALTLAYLNSFFSSGISNYIDQAILKYKDNPIFKNNLEVITSNCKRIDDLPFGYDRKYSAVLLEYDDERKIILKGNIDAVLSKCSFVLCNGDTLPMPKDCKQQVKEIVGDMLSDGMKVLAIAEKSSEEITLSEKDLSDMILMGFIVFFDAPKKTAKDAVEKLHNCSVDVVVLTGDELDVAISVCKRIGISTNNPITGEMLDKLSENELLEQLKTVKLFAELSPYQKEKIINGFKSIGHTVGFLGDGINDIPALYSANVAISVDTAETATKAVADVLLLEKDLKVLADGITEGRKICVNVQKYEKITISSNFGNVLALVIASIFFPFQPMVAIQMLILNILYDLLCFTISFDNVDKEDIIKSRSWNKKGIGKFAIIFGIISTVFDLITFIFLYFVICPSIVGNQFNALSNKDTITFISLFQTGWFLESLWTQTLILNILRTRHFPFIKSKPSLLFLIVMLTGITFATAIPYIPVFREWLGFTSISPLYFIYLVIVVIIYVFVILGIKHLYVKKFKELI